MNKKLKERFDAWDIKSAFLTIGIFLILLLLFLFFSNIEGWLRTAKEERLDGVTTAEIMSVKENKSFSQGRYGTKISVQSYTIRYWYTVNGQRFENTDVVRVTAKNNSLLRTVLNRQTDRKYCLRFDTQNPKRSLLVEN